MFLIAVSILLVLFNLRLTVHGTATRLESILFTFGYGILCSLFATALVGRLVIQLALRQSLDQHPEAMSVLGIRATPVFGRVAIVIPAFPIATAKQTASLDPTVLKEYIETQVGGPVSPTTLKGLENLGQLAHSRRDILLVTDLTRLLHDAGMDPPMLVTDIEFMRSVRTSELSDNSTHNLYIENRSSRPLSIQRLSHVILIGLWSNLASCALADSDEIPFSFTEEPQGRTLRLSVPNSTRSVDMSVNPHGDETEGHGTTPALVARLLFENVTLSILGGTRGLGGPRLGDMLHFTPESCAELWSVDPTSDLWSGIFCPGQGRRGEGYSIWGLFSGAKLLGNRRIGQVMNPTLIPQRGSVNDMPGADQTGASH